VPADLAILYEHPAWFEPLFAGLDRRGVAYSKILLTDHCFDPADPSPPAPVVLSRVAMSGFLREPEHGIFYAAALLDHWERGGAKILNGPRTIAIDSSKARQLSLIAALGHAIPRTRTVHRARDLTAAAAAGMAFPLLVKANIGGSGAGITRYASLAELEQSVGRRHRPRQRGQGAAAPGLRARPRRHDHPHRDTGRPLPLRAGGGEPPRQLRSLPRRRVPGPARPRRHCHARRDPGAPHHRGRRADSRRPPSSTSAGSSW
jgi:hypothetical protein